MVGHFQWFSGIDIFSGHKAEVANSLCSGWNVRSGSRIGCKLNYFRRTYGGQYGIYGSSTTKSVNPSDVIAGILIKQGYIILPELKSELANETLIVNYGESGRRNRGLGYTIEVTIQFSSAKTNEMICSCTAEGQGETEADDIRQAIRRALSSLFPEK